MFRLNIELMQREHRHNIEVKEALKRVAEYGIYIQNTMTGKIGYNGTIERLGGKKSK